MDANIREAIQESISRDCIAHVTIECGDWYNDIIDVMSGADYEDYARENDGSYDVWGTDDNGEEWRLNVTLSFDDENGE